MIASALLVSGCDSEDEAICASNDVAEVCATSSNGRITFSGTGLEAGSEVRVASEDFETSDFAVGDDGTFDQVGAGGYLSGMNALLTFSVSGVDAAGGSLLADITIDT